MTIFFFFSLQVNDYSDFFSDLSAASVDGQKVWVSPTSSYAVYNALGATPVSISGVGQPHVKLRRV